MESRRRSVQRVEIVLEKKKGKQKAKAPRSRSTNLAAPEPRMTRSRSRSAELDAQRAGPSKASRAAVAMQAIDEDDELSENDSDVVNGLINGHVGKSCLFVSDGAWAEHYSPPEDQTRSLSDDDHQTSRRLSNSLRETVTEAASHVREESTGTRIPPLPTLEYSDSGSENLPDIKTLIQQASPASVDRSQAQVGRTPSGFANRQSGSAAAGRAAPSSRPPMRSKRPRDVEDDDSIAEEPFPSPNTKARTVRDGQVEEEKKQPYIAMPGTRAALLMSQPTAQKKTRR